MVQIGDVLRWDNTVYRLLAEVTSANTLSHIHWVTSGNRIVWSHWEVHHCMQGRKNTRLKWDLQTDCCMWGQQDSWGWH